MSSVHPNAASSNVRMCQTMLGARKGKAKRGCTSLSGAIYIMGTLIAAVVGVVSSTLVTPPGGGGGLVRRQAQ